MAARGDELDGVEGSVESARASVGAGGPNESDESDGVRRGERIGPGAFVPADAMRFAFSRSGGPGGQNVNKVSTRAELRVSVGKIEMAQRAKSRLAALAGRKLVGGDDGGGGGEGELVIVSESHRSQARNKEECVERLREMVLAALVEPRVRKKTKPTRGSKERRLDSKKRRGELKRKRREGEG